jgi:small subunit ribosomal protein S6
MQHLSAGFPSRCSPFPNTSIYAKLFLGHSTNLLSVSGVLTTQSGDKPEERRIMMRDYELVIIVTPEFEEEATADIVDKVKSWITDTGGSIESFEEWGRQKFSYLIRKHNEGQYFLFNLKMEPSAVATLERNFRLQESILRFLIINRDD